MPIIRSISQRAFVGGSALYSESGVTQLQEGVLLAVRLSKVTANYNNDSLVIYEDIPESERYGLLEIIDIDKNDP